MYIFLFIVGEHERSIDRSLVVNTNGEYSVVMKKGSFSTESTSSWFLFAEDFRMPRFDETSIFLWIAET